MEFIWLLAIFILLAYTVEALTGFGSIVIALSLGALLMPVSELLPILVPLNILMTGWLTSRIYRHIDLSLLFRNIVPLMLAGTAFGYLLLPWVAEDWLKPLFGLLILWFSARELWRIYHNRDIRHPQWLTPPLMFSAGVTHGLFASGGPLLVYALAGTTLDKTRFRATLIAVWFLLNSSLTIAFMLDGRLQPALPAVLMLAPLLPLGIWIGSRLHHQVDEALFRKLVYGLLMAAGMILLISPLFSGS